MKQIVITAGGTSEKIDNVRKITNSSTGKLGLAIANHLLEKNEDAFIYYVCSKTSVRPNNPRVQVIEVEGTMDLKNKIEELLTTNQIDVFIHSMAVSDYTTDYVTTIDRIKESVRKNPNLDDAFKSIEVIGGNKISSYEDNLVVVLKPTLITSPLKSLI